MPQQPASTTSPARRGARALAWALLGLTILLLAASPVFGLTGGEDWTRVVGFVPVTMALALAYVIVTGLLVGLYAGLVLLATQVRTDLLGVVNRAVEPAHISVWIATSRPGPPT